MQRMKLIINPQSGRGETHSHVEEIRRRVESARQASATPDDYQLDWETTSERKHATEIARQAGEEGYQIVVGIGGDGTVHEVINGVMQLEAAKRPLLGFMPVGTGNDFVYNVGLPQDPAEAARHFFQPQTRVVDAFSVKDLQTGRMEYWNNSLGIGFNGIVNVVTMSKKRMKGFLLYLVSVIESIFFQDYIFQASFSCDGSEPIHERFSFISLCNGPREGGGFPVAPLAIMDDGLISWVTVRHVNRLQMMYFLPVVMAAKQLAYKKIFKPGTAKHVTIKSKDALVIHTDGEQFSYKEDNLHEIEVEVIPGALKILCAD